LIPENTSIYHDIATLLVSVYHDCILPSTSASAKTCMGVNYQYLEYVLPARLVFSLWGQTLCICKGVASRLTSVNNTL